MENTSVLETNQSMSIENHQDDSNKNQIDLVNLEELKELHINNFFNSKSYNEALNNYSLILKSLSFKETTISQYTYAIKMFFIEAFDTGNFSKDKLELFIVDYYNKLKSLGNKNPQSFSALTIILKYIYNTKIRNENLSTGMDEQSIAYILSKSENPYKTLLTVLYVSNVKLKNLLNAKWEDFDFETNTLKLKKSTLILPPDISKMIFNLDNKLIGENIFNISENQLRNYFDSVVNSEGAFKEPKIATLKNFLKSNK